MSLYVPVGRLCESTSARLDICRLFDSVFDGHSGQSGFRLEISVRDFRRLMICQEVVDYYRWRVTEEPACELAILDRLRERQSDGKQNIFMGWPMQLLDFEWPPSLKSDKGVLLELTPYL